MEGVEAFERVVMRQRLRVVSLVLVAAVVGCPAGRADDSDLWSLGTDSAALEVSQIFLSEGYPQGAAHALRLWREQPDSPELRRLALCAAFQAGVHVAGNDEVDEAQAWFDVADQMDPANWQVALERGRALQRAGRSSEAEAALRAALVVGNRRELFEALADHVASQDRYGEAIPLYRQALGLSRTSWSLRGLGFALWRMGRLREALDALREAVSLDPDDVQAGTWMEAVEREAPTEASESGSSEGSVDEAGLLARLRPILQRALAAVEAALWIHEGDAIGVVLFPTDRQFREGIASPDWSAGCFDGRLRLRYETVRDTDPRALEITVRHELVHFLVAQRYRRMLVPVPGWINEGLAVLNEGGDSLDEERLLRPLVTDRDWVVRIRPFEDLEGWFGAIEDPQAARLAYAQSMSAVEFLQARYGRRAPVRILDGMARGVSSEDALRAVTGLDYVDFRHAWREWLCRRPDPDR